MTSSSITVQWGPVDCIHRNGDILGYIVLSHVLSDDKIINAYIGYDVYQASITGLAPSTAVNVSIAAMNRVATGLYSNGIVLETDGEKFHLL